MVIRPARVGEEPLVTQTECCCELGGNGDLAKAWEMHCAQGRQVFPKLIQTKQA